MRVVNLSFRAPRGESSHVLAIDVTRTTREGVPLIVFEHQAKHELAGDLIDLVSSREYVALSIDHARLPGAWSATGRDWSPDQGVAAVTFERVRL